MVERKYALAPVSQDDARVLILGSMPGEASLKAAQYYAHPHNKFWYFISRISGKDLINLPYDDRLKQLQQSRMALWDAIASASRRGSLDSAIRAAEPAPLAHLVTSLPDLRAVAFNGKAAAKIGLPQLASTGLELIVLPSSSPANAGIPLPEKERQWDLLRKYLT